MPSIPINIAFEDSLSEAIIRKILSLSHTTFHIGSSYTRGGFGYLKKAINGFNKAAVHCPFFVLADLDQSDCAPLLIDEWLQSCKHDNLIFRIAVREVEAWLLADRQNFSRYISISRDLIPYNIEENMNPKELLINLVNRSPRRELKADIVPALNSTAQQGPNYNEPLIKFVNEYWDISTAVNNSPSLQKAVDAVNGFQF